MLVVRMQARRACAGPQCLIQGALGPIEEITDMRAVEIINNNESSKRFFSDRVDKVQGCVSRWATFTNHKAERQIYIDLIRNSTLFDVASEALGVLVVPHSMGMESTKLKEEVKEFEKAQCN
jgi:hypothetical protein